MYGVLRIQFLFCETAGFRLLFCWCVRDVLLYSGSQYALAEGCRDFDFLASGNGCGAIFLSRTGDRNSQQL